MYTTFVTTTYKQCQKHFVIWKNKYLQALGTVLVLGYLLCSCYCLRRELNSFHAIWWKERLSLVVCVKGGEIIFQIWEALLSASQLLVGINARDPSPFNDGGRKGGTYIYVSPFVSRLDSHLENFIKSMSPSTRLWLHFYVFRQRNTVLSDKLSAWCGTHLKIVVWETVSFTLLPYRARKEGTTR